MRTILVVDDDPNIGYLIEQYFDRPEYEVYTMLEGLKVAEAVGRIKPDIILLDLKLPDIDGVEVLKDLRKRGFQAPVVIITGYGSPRVAIETIKEGACEFLHKPFNLDELGSLIDRLLAEDNKPKSDSVSREDYGHYREAEGLVGRGPAITKLAKMIGQAASSDAPVLLTGEPGTEKDLTARLIHQNSSRKDKPFAVVNCAQYSPEALEEHLFGRVGSGERPLPEPWGKFEQCNGGSMFLNDVESVDPSIQGKLQTVLDKGIISRRGRAAVEVDVRVIAGSCQNLAKRTDEGKFSRQLFYNLRVISITLPALRERKSDIPELVTHLLNSCRRKGGTTPRVSSRAMEFLVNYSWPGNVRELESNVRSAAEMSSGGQILPEHLPIFHEVGLQAQLGSQKTGDDYSHLFLQTLGPVTDRIFRELKGKVRDKLVESLERTLVALALKQSQENQVKAAALLGISRNTLRERMLKFGLMEKTKAPAEEPVLYSRQN
jgi:two-component system nitrogen regulation response regulator GlnG